MEIYSNDSSESSPADNILIPESPRHRGKYKHSYHDSPQESSELFKTQIRKLEKVISNLHRKHCKLLKEMDKNYEAIEEETHQRYMEFISKWKEQIKMKITQYQSSINAMAGEKNQLKQESAGKIQNLQDRISRARDEKQDLEFQYDNEMSIMEKKSEDEIANLQIQYEHQMDVLIQEKNDLELKLEELAGGKTSTEMYNTKLVGLINEHTEQLKTLQTEMDTLSNSHNVALSTHKEAFESEVITLTIDSIIRMWEHKEFESEICAKLDGKTVELQAWQEKKAGEDLEQLRSRYMQNKERQDKQKRRRNEIRRRVKEWTTDFERTQGRKPDNEDKEAIKKLYVEFKKSNDEISTLEQAMDEIKQEWAQKGVSLSDKSNARSRSQSPNQSLNMSVDSNIATPRAEEIVNKLRWNSISDKTDPGTLRQKLEELDKEATEISQLKKCFKEPALISKTPKHFALPPTELGELKLENKNLKLELQKIKKDITELEACKAQEAQLRQEVQGLQELTQQVEEAEALFERKKESNKTKLADFQGICDMEVTDATERIEQSHIKITALNDRSAIERQKIEELSIELDTESSNLTKLTSEMENLKTLNSNINEVQAQIEALEIKNEELAAMNQEKDQLILESNRKKILLNNEIADMQGKIRVFCRIRPLNEMETKKGSTNILTIQDEYTVYVESFRDFQYDAVFGPHVGQEHVFSETKRLVQSSVDGFNVCIFAYGQTGSGKTYTIQGEGDQIGIAPRAIDELYSILDHLGDSYDWVVTTYMVELYMDQLSDLLEPERVRRNKKLTVKLGRGNVSIPEAKVLEASSSGQLLRIFERGISDRQTNATAMNDISSRSHLIMTVMVNITDKRSGKTAMGKLNFVDLAGCERVNKAKGNASRIKEAMSINKSLSAISNVISALTKGQTHIPYRDHKLTELLSDSLGGTSKTLMFINVSPASYNRKETENALKFASIVKEIKNDPTKNVENREIQQLQKELAMKQQQREQYSRAVTESGITPSRIEELMALKSAILPNK